MPIDDDDTLTGGEANDTLVTGGADTDPGDGDTLEGADAGDPTPGDAPIGDGIEAEPEPVAAPPPDNPSTVRARDLHAAGVPASL